MKPLIEQYPTGWVALDRYAPGYRVVGIGNTMREAFENAKVQGFENPIPIHPAGMAKNYILAAA